MPDAISGAVAQLAKATCFPETERALYGRMEYNEDEYRNLSEPIKLDVCAYSHDTVARRHNGGQKHSVIPGTALELIQVAISSRQARRQTNEITQLGVNVQDSTTMVVTWC